MTTLPAAATTPAAARAFTTATLAAWDVEVPYDDFLLVVDELVTNAVLHGRGQIRVALDVGDETVRVEVADDSAALPIVRPASETRSHGRGLAIVDALADRWGAEARPSGGKAVWAEIPFTSTA